MTSGPQDPQQGGYGQPPYGQSPGQPQYGQPQYGQPQYGQASPGGNPYPAAPQGWGEAPSAGPSERPTTVKAGIGAFLANTVLNVIGTILVFTDLDSYRADLAETGNLTADQVDSAISVAMVVSFLFIAAFAAVLWFAWQGRNWARIVLWVLGGLSVITALSGTSATGGLLGTLQLLLIVAGIVALALKPSNEWYRAEGQRRKRF